MSLMSGVRRIRYTRLVPQPLHDTRRIDPKIGKRRLLKTYPSLHRRRRRRRYRPTLPDPT